MEFLIAVLVVLVAAGSLTAVTHGADLAHDTVMQFNLRQISKVMDMYQITDGQFPKTFEELITSGELKNVTKDYTYVYERSEDGQEGAVLAVKDDKSWCWRSETEEIKQLEDKSSCFIE